MVLKTIKYRFVLVVFDNLSKVGWTAPLKSEKAQTIKNSFDNIRISPKKINVNRNRSWKGIL